MYTRKNFKTKKELKSAILRGERLEIYQPGPFSDQVPKDGLVCLEGPHYPLPHTWYAQAELKDGIIVKVS